MRALSFAALIVGVILIPTGAPPVELIAPRQASVAAGPRPPAADPVALQ
jgi:hypothetical protein